MKIAQINQVCRFYNRIWIISKLGKILSQEPLFIFICVAGASKITACRVYCNFTFTNPRPEDENLGAYYISNKYISHTNTSKSLFEKLYQIVRKYAIGQKVSVLESTGLLNMLYYICNNGKKTFIYFSLSYIYNTQRS